MADGALGERRLVVLERAFLRPGARRDLRVEVGARRGAVDGESLDARRELLSEIETDLSEGRVARHDEAFEQGPAAALAAEVLECADGLRQRQLREERELLGDVDVALDRDRGGHGLERRSRGIHLPPRAREERLGWIEQVERANPLRLLDVVRREPVRVKGRIGVGGDDVARLHVEDDDGSAPTAQCIGRRLLGFVQHRERDSADDLAACEGVGKVLRDVAERPARQLVRVRAFDAGRAELQGLVPDDVREQARRPGRVHALALELIVARQVLGEDDAVRGHDRAARAPDVTQKVASVARVCRELITARDLQIGQLRHDADEQDHHRHADAPDATVHETSCSGSRARAESSDMRSRSASKMKLATSDDPP